MRRDNATHPSIVALLTAGWLVGVGVLVWLLFAVGMDAWADHHGNHDLRSAELDGRAASIRLWLAGVVVLGPALIAVVAYLRGRVRTSVVYLVLAIVLVVPAYFVV